MRCRLTVHINVHARGSIHKFEESSSQVSLQTLVKRHSQCLNLLTLKISRYRRLDLSDVTDMLYESIRKSAIPRRADDRSRRTYTEVHMAVHSSPISCSRDSECADRVSCSRLNRCVARSMPAGFTLVGRTLSGESVWAADESYTFVCPMAVAQPEGSGEIHP